MTKVPGLDDLMSLARECAGAVKQMFLDPMSMCLEWKKDDTPLTVADRFVRDTVAAWRNQYFPDLIVVGEEADHGKRTGNPDEYWLAVDEIDGTWAYMLGMAVFTCMFALMRGNEVVKSVIIDPVTGRLWAAERGKGAFLNGERIRVSQTIPATPAVGVVAWPKRGKGDMLIEDMVVGSRMNKEGCLINPGIMGELHRNGHNVIQAVTIGYLDALVASGQFQGTIFPGPTQHDTAAGHLLVEEAGGVASDLLGRPLVYDGRTVYGHIFACDQGLHSLLRRVVRWNMQQLEIDGRIKTPGP